MDFRVAAEDTGQELTTSSPKTLEGSLRSFNLFEVLQFLQLGSMTGILTIRNGENDIRLSVRRGKIVNSSIFTHRQRLGEMIVARGVLTRRELEDILVGQRLGSIDVPLGQVLLEREVIDQETLSQLLRLQLEEEIWTVLGWEDGDFHFAPADEITENAPAMIELEIEPLMLEESRRQDEWKLIREIISSDELIPTPLPPTESHDPDPSLTANEWRLLSLINGRADIGVLVDRSGLGRFETFRILAGFVRQDWVACRPPEATDEEYPEQDAQPEPAPKANGSALMADADESGRATGIFSWKKRGPGPSPEPVPQTPSKIGKDHTTLISLGAAVANELLATLESRGIGQEQNLWPMTQECWLRWSRRFPASDGIRAVGNRLDTTVFDAFWPPIQSPVARALLMEDCWGALGEVIVNAVAALASNLPSKECGKVTSRILAALESAKVRHEPPAGLGMADLAALLDITRRDEESDDGR
jgi:hypothetical protein